MLLMNINWKQVYQHILVGLIAALAVFTSLSTDSVVTWHVWVAAVAAFLVASGGSASTSGPGVLNPSIPSIDNVLPPLSTPTMLVPVQSPAPSVPASGVPPAGNVQQFVDPTVTPAASAAPVAAVNLSGLPPEMLG